MWLKNNWIALLAIATGIVAIWFARQDSYKNVEDKPAPVEPPAEPPPTGAHNTHIEGLEGHAGISLRRLANVIIREEGKRSVPYLDSAGVVTIGIGRSLGTHGISLDELHVILPDPDYRQILKHARVRHGRIYVDSLSSAHQIFPHPLTEDDMMLLLSDDLKTSTEDAKKVFGADWSKIDTVRQEAIVDLLYNLGLPHFKGFKEFIASVKASDWNKAASDLLMSKAARQNITRYHRSASVIQTGDAKYFEL